MNAIIRLVTYQGIPVWRDARVLRAVSQIVSAVVVLAVMAFIVSNVMSAAQDRGLSLGLGFLSHEAGFPISESIIHYEESRSFLYAFIVGALNMLKVSLIGIVLATFLGIFIGASRLSTNWLVRQIAGIYIETVRNVPLLVQLFFWYFAVFQTLPRVRESFHWPGPIFLNNRGVFVVWARPTEYFDDWMIFALAGVIAAFGLRFALGKLLRTGQDRLYALALPVLALTLVTVTGWFFLNGAPMSRDVPVLGRFNFEGGLRLTPEFAALLLGLVTYTASFIAEIVRAGIQSVHQGQVEAARALGLGTMETLRRIVFPQALRVIIPPLISQYLNLTKNSSLAIAIGYPDLFGVGRIMINQAGRAIPVFALIMVSYLIMSLTYAIAGNLYNRFALGYLRRTR